MRYEIRRSLSEHTITVLNNRLPAVLQDVGFENGAHYLPFEYDFGVVVATADSVDGLLSTGISPNIIEEVIAASSLQELHCKFRGGVPGPLQLDRIEGPEYKRLVHDVREKGFNLSRRIGMYTLKIEPVKHGPLSSRLLRNFFARFAPMSPILNTVSEQYPVLWTEPSVDHEQNRVCSLGIDAHLSTKIGSFSLGPMKLEPVPFSTVSEQPLTG